MQFDVKTYADFKVAVEELCARLTAENIPAEQIFDSKLIVHELVGNVLQHAGCGASLRAELSKEFIHITVRGERAYEPPKEGSCPSCFAERGRGLYLVDTLSAERIFTEKGEILVRIRLREKK